MTGRFKKKNKKAKFPNPAFFRAKDNMDWRAQAANIKEISGIVCDMVKEAIVGFNESHDFYQQADERRPLRRSES